MLVESVRCCELVPPAAHCHCLQTTKCPSILVLLSTGVWRESTLTGPLGTRQLLLLRDKHRCGCWQHALVALGKAHESASHLARNTKISKNMFDAGEREWGGKKEKRKKKLKGWDEAPFVLKSCCWFCLRPLSVLLLFWLFMNKFDSFCVPSLFLVSHSVARYFR